MTRFPGLLVAGLLLAAAAATQSCKAASPSIKGGFATEPFYGQTTIDGPRQTASAEPGPTPEYTPAPVPDIDQAAPLLRQLGPAQAELKPGFFTNQKTFRGDGYVPGSSVQGSQDRHIRPGAGISLAMPLQ